MFKLPLILTLLLCGSLFSQVDSVQLEINEHLKKIEEELKVNPILKKEYEDLTFYYSQVLKNLADSQKTQGFKLSGYIDAYYARYSDHIPLGRFQKFPTSAPVSGVFGLNMAMLSISYQNKLARGVATFHAGDIPRSAWSPQYNYIQEAYVGLKLVKDLWLDAGFFRTHLGLESIQPRENIASSLALTTYYEPYYLSGAKLTYYPSKKISLQVNCFNGFNTFVPVNSKVALGFSAVYEPREGLVASYNLLLSDNSPDSLYRQARLYQNFYLAYKSRRLNFGYEMNFGMQENTGLHDSNNTAYMYSFLLAGKYKMNQGKYAIYARTEVFNDKDEILTGQVVNAYNTLVGLHAFGATAGLEFKPISNSFLRLEGRYIHLWNDENIFYTRQQYTNIRHELIASMGVWF